MTTDHPMTEPAPSPNSPLPDLDALEAAAKNVAKCLNQDWEILQDDDDDPIDPLWCRNAMRTIARSTIEAYASHATLTAERDEARADAVAREILMQDAYKDRDNALAISRQSHAQWERATAERDGYKIGADTMMGVAGKLAERLKASESARDAALAEVAKLAKSLESLCAWLLHRFGPDSAEGEEAGFRLRLARAALAPKGAPDV